MKRLVLIDGNSLFFRAYYATAYAGGNLMKNTKGVYTNGVFAFVNMIEKILEKPYSHALIAFDTPKKTKRHEQYEDYKAGRAPMPEEMQMQIPLIHAYLKALNVSDYSLEGYEADDIIGTLSVIGSKAGYKVDVYSSDRDLLQLIDDNVTIHLIKKGVTDNDLMTPKTFMEKYEISHELMVDLKALMGDPSDNIPGVPGVGEKTAIKLLQTYGSLDEILKNKDDIKGKLGEKIRENVDKALLSKELATIDLNVPLTITFDELAYRSLNYDELVSFYNECDFHAFIKKLDKPKETIETFKFKVVNSHQEIKNILKSGMAVHLELYDFNYHKSDLVGFSLADENNTYFIPTDIALESIDFQMFLSDDSVTKYTFDSKAMKVALLWKDLDFNGVAFDMLLAAYLINQKLAKDDFKVICMAFDYEQVDYDEQIYGKGAKKQLPLENIYQAHVAKKARAIFDLRETMIESLKSFEQLDLYQDIELPLAQVLARMEYNGVFVDKAELNRQKANLKGRIDQLELDIYESVGKQFNISSPKQLGEVLFVDLGLETSKKTKTKNYSTNIDVLNNLVDKHPVIKLILEYRQLTKLYSTYIEGIEQSIFEDGKVHTIYAQALTATGRLSSLEPNLQNIPVRTAEGREIRKLFVAKDKHYLLAADYSQIELRVLADLAKVENLIKAFNDNKDIHEQTAREVFGSEVVTADERRKAKAVNFGIIYGIGAWSLAEDIGVTPREAQHFIDRYLDVYPEIKKYMDETIENAIKLGYVKTMMNRRRYISELESPMYQVKEFGKRTAMNAPIQGSAADIIKIAMIKLQAYLLKNKKKSKLLLQVHDELILEVPEKELEEMKQMVPEIMANAVKLSVSLKTSCDVGTNWFEV